MLNEITCTEVPGASYMDESKEISICNNFIDELSPIVKKHLKLFAKASAELDQ